MKKADLGLTRTFIEHKAGMQARLASMEPEDDAILVLRINGVMYVHGVGHDNSCVTALGLLEYGKQHIFACMDEYDDE